MTRTATSGMEAGREQYLDSIQLLSILKDGRFHSGEEIGIELGISRSAVWKRVKKINEKFGVNIHSVRGRGYRLAQKMLALAPEGRFHGKCFSWNVSLLNTVDSTNAEALRRLARGREAPFAVVAEQQTGGRGRRGRVWVSPFGENLYFSVVIKIDRGVKQLEGLSLVVGLAIVATLRKSGVQDVGLKWPNDVLASGRKISGVLLELSGDLADVCHVVIGIGINANMLLAAEAIDQPWTSASIETGSLIDRNELLAELQRQLDEYLAAHNQAGFVQFIDAWNRNDLWRGRLVDLSSGDKKVSGIVHGVDSTGALILLVDGVLKTFSGGELSLRLHNDT